MYEDIIVRTVGSLVEGLNKGIAAIKEHSGKLNLYHAIAADLPTRLANLTSADTAHKEAVRQLRIRRQNYQGRKGEVIIFIRLVRELLRNRFGKSYSQRWAIIGFTRSFAIPRSEGDLLRILHSIRAYLAVHSIPHGVALVTSARAQEL
ncbi:MAG: hypothetical protein ACK4UN_11375, partial [Limisphaerales bacterium]